jgi:hypothetical protein
MMRNFCSRAGNYLQKMRKRRTASREALMILAVLVMLASVGCGGSSSSGSRSAGSSGNAGGGSVQNAVQLTVNSGPAGTFVNGAFVTITICVAGTANCGNIDNVLVDTGSAGLRVLASALPVAGLAAVTTSAGIPLASCGQFADLSFTWGPMRLVDLQIGGEVAKSLPIQVIADPAYSVVPSQCSSIGGQNNNTVQTLGANGILGIGPFVHECPACVTSANPGIYFACSTPTNCVSTTATLAQQMQNPVPLFPQDNNGVLIQLPAIAATGAPSATGTLIFGIGTQANNGLGTARVFGLDSAFSFKTTYKGQTFSGFIDSGSNGFFFPDSTIPTCTNTAQFGSGITSFFCPAPSPMNLTATNTGIGINNAADVVNFSLANAESLFSSPLNNVFNNVGGPFPNGQFDWGITFHFGRDVFTGIESKTVPGGPTGPFFAYQTRQ